MLKDTLTGAFAPVEQAVAGGRIPGAALGIVTTAGERAVTFAGQAQITPVQVPMRRETVFDLASLTKVIFTTTTILRLIEQGRMALDQRLG